MNREADEQTKRRAYSERYGNQLIEGQVDWRKFGDDVGLSDTRTNECTTKWIVRQTDKRTDGVSG